MSIYKELSYENYIEQVKGIRFCILSPAEIKSMSVAEITKTDTYIGTEPQINGLFDPRMGVLDHNKLCHTCEQRNTFCPGHFGHITLAKPVFYIQFFDIVRKLLKCVCWRCSKILVDINSPQVKAILNKKYSRQKKWELMYKLCSKVKRCGQETEDGCKAKMPDKIYREPIVKIIMEWKDVDKDQEELKKQVLNAEEVIRILQRITDDDAEALGFHRKYNRPEWMICTALPVPPPAVRPSVRTDTGLRSEDDLTHKLRDIVKNNNTLKSKIEKGASKEQIDIAGQVLQYHVATFIDNDIPGINPAQQRTGRLLKSLTERLKSKDGRIRGNLMGKRVDFSARSVITPDPNISIDELGVPIKIAMNLTFPEVVNKYNKEKLLELVRNGPEVYPGAKCLRQGGRTFLLKNKDRNAIELNEGDVVERHMLNGDYVLFNRQPSLHRMSMMGHRVVVMPFNTFRSNPSVCPCFNSDYDGDEMNAHLPQSIVTMNELIELTAVPTQIISPRECKPIIAIVQDVPLGVYRLTKSHVNLNHKQFLNLMSLNPRYIGHVPAPLASKNGVDKWTGSQILSTIIPKNINVKSGNKSYDGPHDKENFVVIENGNIKQGILDKQIYQNRTKGLIHSIFNECGSDETRMFFDNTQRIICDWLVNNGFSVGISDLIIDTDTQDNLKNTIHDMKVKVYDIISQIHTGKFENRSIVNNNDFFEEQVNKLLNQASSQAGNHGMAKINDITNRMINMIRSGSKGNVINVSQMIACLGQVNVEGKRIAYGFENRTLPHYAKYDDGPESRGFVESSFINGLNPQEFFFHSMGGREGLIDTAVKSVTAETKILIIENKKPKVVEIGKWIDQHMESGAARIQFKPEKQTELLELDTEVFIPNMDSKGHMLWSPMKYVTRHDPDNHLYVVTTRGGRSVIVTQYDSMLVWDKERQEFLTKPTSTIQPGECVPVTSKFPTAPIVTETVDIADYLPKTEFLYGTDFLKAVAMMNAAMEGRGKIPTGWWDAHNGTDFVLPYPSKARLQRVMVRSDLNAIKEGGVYNFAAKRGECSIPDKFPLDKDFGTFIGLYLAEGCCHVKSGKVGIANIDTNVHNRVQSWMNKYNIKNWVETREMELRNANGEVVSTGTTSSVWGNSTILAKLLDKFVGHGAAHKFVPNEAFTAPDDFAIGIINGYFAGDGSVSPHSISASSTSETLIHGISLLCSRFGAFGKIRKSQTEKNNLGTKNILPTYTLDIRSRFAQRLRSKVDFIINYKNEKLRDISCSLDHRNFPEENDVVMDMVMTIVQIDVEKHPKVYDVTVPGTYNFALLNGLSLHDTSETGYLQRKLVKAMEDCKIGYDLTVRNASGAIVQFLYGEDGMDPTKIESQSLPYIEKDFAQLRDTYLLTEQDAPDMKMLVDDDILSAFLGAKDWQDKMRAHFDKVVEDREFIIRDIFKNTLETTIMYPVSFQRIITNACSLFKNSGMNDLNPLYALIELEKLCDTVCVTKWNKGNVFFQILARAFLSPKRCIMEYKFDKNTFDFVIQQIRHRFYDAIAHPSEMVGVISAQSIGEPATQMTLNTFHLSGVSSASKAVRGVPRMKEILSVTKNIKAPALTIHLKRSIRHDKAEAKKVLNTIQTTLFKDIVKHSRIYFDPDDFNTTIEDDKLFLATYKEFIQEELLAAAELTPWLLRLDFDKEKMKEFEITMMDVGNVLFEFYRDTVNCMFSDDSSNNLVMRIKLPVSNDAEKDVVTELKALEKNIMENIIVNGVRGVNKVVMNNREFQEYNPETRTFQKTNEWVLETNGTNLIDILGHKNVDPITTMSNDITEIYELLGIEAARYALYHELSDIIKDADLYVNYRHISLLVDTMTNKGYLLSIDRHGINRVDIGPLAKCSFEEVTDMLVKAGIFSEMDKIGGVSANIMLGQIPPYGTGETDILIDEYKLAELQPIDEDEPLVQADPFINAQDPRTLEEICDIDNIGMSFQLPAKDSSIARLHVPIVVN